VPALIGVGLSHRNAPLALRERVALGPDEATELLRALLHTGVAGEAVALSTCNRTELYAAGPDAPALEDALVDALARRARMSSGALRSHVAVLRGTEVADHLFAVAGGLDSMVLGEVEILGQLRRAHAQSRAAGACGPVVDRLVRDALGAGRRARTGTAIGRCGVSVSSAAVELARDALGSLADRRVLLVGAGKSSEVTAKVLRSQGVRVLSVANRGRDRAAALAGPGGAAVAFEALDDHLAEADLVLAATACPHVMIDSAAVARATARRAGRPLVLVDLAVPRDIDPECGLLPGVTLVDIDGLQAQVRRNHLERQAEARRAEGIVEEEIHAFAGWLGTREVMPTVTALRAQADELVAGVLAENEGRWEALGERDRARVEAMLRATVNRLLHEPTRRLRALEGDRRHASLQLLRDLFGLEDAPAAGERPSAEVRELRPR
jgi:glutamyl-tRNA reductase